MKNAILTLCLLAASCASTQRLHFVPAPHELSLQPQENGAVIGRVYSTVVGAVRSEETGDWRLHLRMRVENEDDAPLRVRPDSVRLLDSRLHAFGTVVPEPALGTEIPPFTTRVFELYFPMPRSEPRVSRLESVHLRYSIEHADGHAEVSAGFERWDESPVSTGIRWSFGYTNYCW